MLKIIALLLGCILLFNLLDIPSAQAAFCRTVEKQTICILEIKRSAKNFWEYRAAVSINGKTRPIELYDCRKRVRVRADGAELPFAAKGAGELICRTLNRA
jgi:hypothetical protein